MKKPKLMHIAPEMKQRSFIFEIPPSQHKTTVRIEVEIYQGEGSALIAMEPTLGDGMEPPNKFRWAGHEYPLPPQGWWLLYMLMQTYEKRLPIDTVYEKIWEHENLDGGDKLNKVMARLNECLDGIKKGEPYPHRVGVKAGWVILDYKDEERTKRGRRKPPLRP